MISLSKHLWASTAAALIGSLCCVGPLVLVSVGVGGAWIGRLTALEPYRPIFIAVTLILLATAFRQLYLVPARCKAGADCADPRTRRRQRQVFWIVLAGLTALITFPWYAPRLLN